MRAPAVPELADVEVKALLDRRRRRPHASDAMLLAAMMRRRDDAMMMRRERRGSARIRWLVICLLASLSIQRHSSAFLTPFRSASFRHGSLHPLHALKSPTRPSERPSPSGLLSTASRWFKRGGVFEKIEDLASHLHYSQFDIRKAVLLAGFSFQAYNEPRAGKWERSANGNDVAFQSADFIRQVFDGLLLVTVLEASDLVREDSFLEAALTGFESDPYVVVSLADASGTRGVVDRTRTVKSSSNPKWQQTLSLYTRGLDGGVLNLRVLDEELFSNDDELGVVTIDVDEIRANATLLDEEGHDADGGGRFVWQGWLPLQKSAPDRTEDVRKRCKRGQGDHAVDERPNGRAARHLSAGDAGKINVIVQYVPFERDDDAESPEEGSPSTPPSYDEAEAIPPMDESDMAARAKEAASVLEKAGEGGPAGFGCSADWSALARQVWGLEPWASDFEFICFLQNVFTCTQVGLWRDNRRKRLVVAFRGTEMTSWRDFLTDITLVQEPLQLDEPPKAAMADEAQEMGTRAEEDSPAEAQRSFPWLAMSGKTEREDYTLVDRQWDPVKWLSGVLKPPAPDTPTTQEERSTAAPSSAAPEDATWQPLKALSEMSQSLLKSRLQEIGEGKEKKLSLDESFQLISLSSPFSIMSSFSNHTDPSLDSDQQAGGEHRINPLLVGKQFRELNATQVLDMASKRAQAFQRLISQATTRQPPSPIGADSTPQLAPNITLPEAMFIATTQEEEPMQQRGRGREEGGLFALPSLSLPLPSLPNVTFASLPLQNLRLPRELELDPELLALASRVSKGEVQVDWDTIDASLYNLTAQLQFRMPEVFAVQLGGNNSDPRVHAGFHQAYLSIRSRLHELIHEATGGQAGEWEVLVTGHSLGGALATLCAYDMATHGPVSRGEARGPPGKVLLYNYGAPRVGNGAFVEKFNAKIGDAFRVVNSRDVIARLPRGATAWILDYEHVGRTVLVDEAGQTNLWIEGETEGPNPLQEANPWGKDENGTLVFLGRSVELPRLTEEFIDREVAMLNTITNGEALSHHFEDQYHAAMTVAVAQSLREGRGAGGSSRA
ncbi:unnamed protein product [Vitrella brassicaformis CCMP3155]|uniref:C2 domain-containing protein n=4 Tax=Vitrella brassicaformis TaxID=1169539 RepID=A0A0G4EHV0_VITBC|nr:unnamed protein product [Vitrella brassicaformis CCMP3155]|eukprot:CEL96583.1 unnamed protein product [Vitrella brassicaformis CCMP3155]